MKNIILTTFVLGLSTAAIANEDLDELYATAFTDNQTTGTQPMVGSSRDSSVSHMIDNSSHKKDWYDNQNGS